VAPKVVRPRKSTIAKGAVNDIDRYVYARLDKAGLKPSPEADRETLINRVTLDLTGLPPTLAEVDAFVSDMSPRAYERLVDRLLASPAYGERMTTYWMDVARYGESDGYLDDNIGRTIYPWRDWVISAFNSNMPYDKFVTWQLAGDKLKNPTREQLLATAFARVGKRSTENGLIDEEYRVEYRNERSELVGKAFLGLTVGCAKCHDHKYDVISQKDYYSLAGFFNSVDERGFYAQAQFLGKKYSDVGPSLPWPTPEEKARWDAARLQLQVREAGYRAAVTAARSVAASRVDAGLKQGGPAAATALNAAIDAATIAYYPLDELYLASFDPIKTRAFGGIPGAQANPAKPAGAKKPAAKPAGLQKASLTVSSAPKRLPPDGSTGGGGGPGGGTPGLARARSAPPPLTIPSSFRADKLRWTRSGRPGEPGAVIEDPKLIPGARGKALLIDGSIGFLGPREVGRFERNDSFSIDLWIKPRADKPYEAAPIAYYQDHNVGTGDAGYSILSDHDRVRFDLINTSPNNMISVVTAKPVPRGKWTHVAVTYDGSSKAGGAKIYIDGKPAELEVRRDNLTRSILPQVRFGPGAVGGGFWGFSFGRRFRAEEFNQGGVDEIRLFNKSLTPAEAAWLHDPRTAQQDLRALRESLLQIAAARDPQVVRAAEALRQAREAENLIATNVKTIMVLGDTPKPRPTYLLTGGLYDKPAEEVRPQALERVFHWNARLPRDRLGLTRWMFDKKNPLISRVFVNRLWMLHFGSGIVETVEDFGTQGANPTNPELLDYLAVEFERSGWDIKHMHKLMVMSATYRQSSRITPEHLQKDARNLLLARGPRYRLPAEMIRDNALFASGLLVDKKGGESVFPYQPEGVWTTGAIPVAYPTDVPDDEHHRRSMYTFIKRTSQFPSLTVFDQADRSVSTVQRRLSNTPLQALVLLNDVQYLEAYRKLAERAMLSTADPDRQIEMVFRLATRRRPVVEEMSALKALYASETQRLGKSSAAVDSLLSQGVSPVDPRPDRLKLAVLSTVTGAVMNSPDAFTLR
jgi:hypothetical protein